LESRKLASNSLNKYNYSTVSRKIILKHGRLLTEDLNDMNRKPHEELKKDSSSMGE
jgi:hypothetical protein